jgi:hypothetical protein
MDEETLKARVDKILEDGDSDPEESHAAEDELLSDIIVEVAPQWVREQIKRIWDAELTRWCA